MTPVTEEGGRRGLGLLGGTFDPPHIGHLAAAVSARHALDLDTVLLVPAGDPWQKRGTRDITPGPLRLEMVEGATRGLAGLRASDVEVRRPGPSYTLDTIVALREDRPDLAITLVLGRDAVAGIRTWHRWEDVLARAEVAVIDRDGEGIGDLDLPAGMRVTSVPMPRLDVSSTDLRRRVAAGEPIDVLTPPPVVRIIAERGLYRVGDDLIDPRP